MKKLIIALLVALLVGTAGTGAYLYSSGYFEEKSEEIVKEVVNDEILEVEEEKEKLPPIKNDEEYAKELSLVVQDYADAMYLMSGILSVDTDTIEPETWKEMLDMNYNQWESVEERAVRITEYLESDEAGFFPTAYAQESDLSALEDFEPPQNPAMENLTTTKFNDDPNATIEAEIKGEDPFIEENIKIMNEVSKDPVLKRIMKKWGYTDARLAMDMLEEARIKYQEDLNKDLNLTAQQARMLIKVRNASFTTVAGLGIIASGGTLLSSAGAAWGGVEYLAASNLVFGSTDMLLKLGEEGYIVDNRFGKTMFKEIREDYSIPNKIIGFLSLKDPTNIGGNMITLYNYKEGVEALISDQEKMSQEQLYELSVNKDTDYLGIKRNSDSLSRYKDPNLQIETLIQLVPPGKYLVDGEEVIVPGLNPENTVEPEIEIGPAIENLRLGEYVAKITIIDELTGIPSIGEMTFYITEDSDPYGTATLVTEGTTSVPGVATTIKGNMTSSLTGTFDPSVQQISLSGPYTSNNTTTMQGKTVPTTETGTLSAQGVWSDGGFTGTITATSSAGIVRTVDWTGLPL